MNKIKTTDIAAVREAFRAKQGHRCALCRLPLSAEAAVLDHCHTTGAIRGALHRSCNALLGRVENNYRRYGVKDLAAWAHGMPAYLDLHKTNITGLLHPTHKTAEEKRERRNALARKRRRKA